MSKMQILNSVKDSLAKNKFVGDFNPHFKNIIKSQSSDLLEEYIQNQINNKAKVIESSKDNLIKDIKKVLEEFHTEKILYALDLPFEIKDLDFCEKIPYDKDIEENRDEIFHIDSAILNAVCGVANLGIIGTISSVYSPRLTSLITPNCIILLDKTRIVPDLFSGIQALKATSNVLPTNMLFIAGPSRTADIELLTVFGVHGPQNAVIILY